MKYPVYTWDEKIGVATCTFAYKNERFVGKARCHPEDEDMKNKLTGSTLAEWRALIKLLKFQKKELVTELHGIKVFYNTIKDSKLVNSTGFEMRMLRACIKEYEAEIKEIKEEIAYISDSIKNYIETKNNLYALVRKKRG